MVQSWNNADNLYLVFGPDKATPKKAGEYSPTTDMHEVQVTLNLADVDGAALSTTPTVLDNTVTIPSGARIQEVRLLTKTAAATITALEIGLARRVTAGATTLTEIDYDGLINEAPVADFNAAGETNIYRVSVTVPTGLTGTGALIGTTTTNVGLITGNITGATGTGILVITIVYYMP